MFVSFMCLAALFSGLPTVQFVIRRPVQFYPVNDISVYLEREREGGGGVPDPKAGLRPDFVHVFIVLNQDQYAFHFQMLFRAETTRLSLQLQGTPPPFCLLR